MYIAFFFALLFGPTDADHSHSCSYQVPKVDDVILGVVLDNRPRWKRRSENLRSLRIALHYDDGSIKKLSESKRAFVQGQLLPSATGFWERALLVQRTDVPIRLNRKCKSSQYYVHPDDRQSCAGSCRNETKCGEVRVPDQHLFQCRFCENGSPWSCKRTGVDGPGVWDADFLLYVSAVHSDRCRNPETIAYAAHCQQEARLDRPIAGHVNLCPKAVSTESKDHEVLISTVKHEILHALGFSAGLFAFYRDADGNPRTPRNQHGRPLQLSPDRGYFQWSPDTVREIKRDWWALHGRKNHSVHLMVTPKVREEARRHFGCPELEGAELENQGREGTALTHWEKRLFENEAMTGTHTQNPVYSRLTLALMEDTGWYRANYSVADDLHWGRQLGCLFATKSCGEWMFERRRKGLSTAPFCSRVKGHSQSTTTCTDARDSVALCNLVDYGQPIPQHYRNFHEIPGVAKADLLRYGGSVELADYCPYNQEFEWKNDSSSPHRRDSRCEFESNTPTGLNNAALESYGEESSRCFHHYGKWKQRRCGFTRTFQHYGAGCYQTRCEGGLLWVETWNGTGSYPCYHQGQAIHIRQVTNGWLHEGLLICPPCTDLCSKCAQESIPAGEVGDPWRPEPCDGARPFLSLLCLLCALRHLSSWAVS